MNERWEEYKKTKGLSKISGEEQEARRLAREEQEKKKQRALENEREEERNPFAPDLNKLPPISDYYTTFGDGGGPRVRGRDAYDSGYPSTRGFDEYDRMPSNYSSSFMRSDMREDDFYPNNKYSDRGYSGYSGSYKNSPKGRYR